jgi:mRNA interferase HigB
VEIQRSECHLEVVRVRVLSRRRLREFWEEHPDAQAPLDAWHKRAEKADWRKFADLKADYATADLVGPYVVINIGGNKYRLILEIFFESGVILVRHVLTHKEYDLGQWKEQPKERSSGQEKGRKGRKPKGP